MPGYERNRIVGLSDQDLDEFTCGICQGVLDIPLFTKCCRQTYCKTCIDEWLTTHSSCPNDRKLLFFYQLAAPPRLVLNLLNNLKIKCDFEDNGCPVVSTIGELSKHVEECDHKPDISCRTCGLNKAEGEEHNCIEDLMVRHQSVLAQIDRMHNEIEELKHRNPNVGQSSVIESDRRHVNDYVLEHRAQRIDNELALIFVEICKHALLTCDSFADMVQQISDNLDNLVVLREDDFNWHVIAFSLEGGESMACGISYFRIRFESVVIEIFSTLRNP